MEKPMKPSLTSHRRLQSLDVKKSSSSLNMSTSSMRSINEDRESAVRAGRRSTTVRFAPPPPSSASTTRSSHLMSQQAKGRSATARPASTSGPKTRSSAGAGSLLGGLPESGPKALRRSWGWTGSEDAKEREIGVSRVAKSEGREATTEVRSSSVPRRLPTEEKPLHERESKIKITTGTKANSDSPPKPDVSHKPSMQRSPSNARKTSEKQASSSASLNNTVKVSPSSRTSTKTIGASWESLPLDLQSLGLEVMSYRDAAEMAAIEALQEASAAEVLLRCLSAFADLTSSAAEQSPHQTVNEFLALHATLTRSTAVLGGHQGRHTEDWLRAAVDTDLAPFHLYSAPSPRKSSTASPSVSPSPPEMGRPVTAGETAAEAAMELGEQTCAWFLGYVERLLDADVAGTLGQLRRVNDWLDAVALRSSEGVERLRKKIFRYLLDHVESTVVALNGGVAPSRRK